MKKIAITYLLVVFIMGMFFTNPLLSATKLQNHDFIIDDFSGFTIYHDTNLVTSSVDDIELKMIHNDESGLTAWETFFFGFGSENDYGDFNLELSLDYNYTGSMLTQVSLFIGSYYFENGTFDNDTPLGYRRICACGIWDAWASSGGKYYVSARPFGEEDQYESSYNVLPSSGSVSYKVTRINDNLNVSIIKDGIIQMQHLWTEGVSRPLSYLYLAMSIDPNYCTYTEVTFTSLYVEMNTTIFDGNTRSSVFPSITLGIPLEIISLIIILQVGVINYQRKSKKY